MDKAKIAYAAYMLFFLVFAGSMVLVPFLAFGQDMSGAYGAFAPTCHQKLSRSFCVFNNNESYWIADCTSQGGAYVSDLADRRGVSVSGADGTLGYKMPVCARDFGIYFAMLLAGAAYPFVRRIETRAMYPAAYLIIAMVPIAVDGGLQLLTEIDKPLFGANILPFEYESTNLMRLATGAIAGFAASFYAIPILVNVFGGQDYREEFAKMRAETKADKGPTQPGPAEMQPRIEAGETQSPVPEEAKAGAKRKAPGKKAAKSG